jgi:acetyl esterase/lipase
VRPTFIKFILIFFGLIAVLFSQIVFAQTKILCLGDSITEGAPTFQVYRPLLAKKLSDAHLAAAFVGPKQDKEGLRHAGYGGFSIEAVSARYQSFHAEYPADILLIHSGHNHSVEEKPIPGILHSTESIIAQARQDNPRVIVLLAKVIASGKLPKYEYIPALNEAIEALGKRLNQPAQPVLVVDQADGFDWRTDTIQDLVHPNAAGAEKMAEKWFQALKPLLAKSPERAARATGEIGTLPATAPLALAKASKVLIYKTVDGVELEMHVFVPETPANGKLHPAVLFIHGGGWVAGDPSAHALESLYLSSQGMVAATIRYRLLGDSTKNRYAIAKSPADCLSDAKSAMRFFRSHAADFSVDPNRIAAGGGSAGGHLAAALADVDGFDDPHDDLAISCKPNALVLLYPAFDLIDGWKGGIEQCRKSGIDVMKFSPATLANKEFPPTLILAGNLDPISPPASNQAFIERMKPLGVSVELFSYNGKAHKLFERERADLYFQSYLIHSNRFFQELGWIDQRPLPALPEVGYTRTKTP